MVLNLDNAELRKLIPNVIHEVEGEVSLYNKLLPWLESARNWLEMKLLGSSFEPEGEVRKLVLKIIVARAFASAVPSLDLTLSPAGFAVISTEGRAPASKERVARLIESLNSSVDANTVVLRAMLNSVPEWTGSNMGRYFREVCIPDFDGVRAFLRKDADLFGTYRRMHRLAVNFETSLARYFIGEDLLADVHENFPDCSAKALNIVYSAIRDSAFRFIQAHFDDSEVGHPDEHELWHLAEPVIYAIRLSPELHERWQLDMGEVVNRQLFKNTRKGGYWF